MESKTCSKCNQLKTVDNFYKNPLSKNGYRSQCRHCELSARAANHIKNKRDNENYFWRMKAKYANDTRFRTISSKSKMVMKIQASEFAELYYQKSFCHYCNIGLPKEIIVFDHKIPMARDGEHKIGNICVSCKDCNNLKGTRTEIEFLEFLNTYLIRFKQFILHAP
jgi:5-methylcytosine-specific restriction endonuclease McrA